MDGDEFSIEAKRLEVQALGIKKDLAIHKWSRLTSDEVLIFFAVCVGIVSLFGTCCYGCNRVYDVDAQLHAQGLMRDNKDRPLDFGKIVPEKAPKSNPNDPK